MTRSLLRALAGLLSFASAAYSAEFHVSPDAPAGGKGSARSPFRTLQEARDAARQLAGKEAVTIHVADGTYYLPEALVLNAADSGSEAFPILYRAEHEGKAVISGGTKLDLKWEAAGDGRFKATTPDGLHMDQLFIGGKRQRMARYPNYDASRTTDAWQGFAADAFSKERAARWSNPAGGFIHAMHVARWGGYHYRITGKNPDGTVRYEGGWQNNRQMGMHPQFRMVENIFEELDAPGEWFHDEASHTLYFIPEPGMNLEQATVEVVRLNRLIDFRGDSSKPVHHLTFQGFVFRHAARTFMDNREPLLRSDWTIYRGGAVTLTGTDRVSLLDCEFDQPGGNAIFVNSYNRRTLIKGCHIHDTGASGVCFVGDPNAVRSPLFEYGKSQDLSKIDRTPGPKTENYPADGIVEDCLIHGIGRVERQPAGVQISMSLRISVRDCSIYDCARAGINISEGTWGGHLIDGCDVFDTVLETHDHGSFNSWGRDRYWTSNHRGVSEPEVIKDPKLPFLDVIEPIVIRNSRWRCDHGWDIDLDDGSSHYLIENNLLLHGGLKFREGYGRKAFNNVLVNSGFHPHVWFRDSDSEFRHNIVMAAHAPIGQPEGWGAKVDENCFSSEVDRRKHLNSGADAHSVAGDPLFMDPAKGDFRVKEGSLAWKIGFRNFPMDRFGVKKPALKAIAKTPVIPELKSSDRKAEEKSSTWAEVWLGATLHSLEGEEFSAFGTRREDGGVQLVKVPDQSAAAQAGLKANDLIQHLNDRRIGSTADLFDALLATEDAPMKLRIVRNQQPREVILNAVPRLYLETAENAGDFRKIRQGAAASPTITTSSQTSNDPLTILSDGKLGTGYGPVFQNGTRRAAYRLDLGKNQPIQSVSAWSYRENGNRSCQRMTIYGSSSNQDPGMNLEGYTAIATIDTSRIAPAQFQATSLQAPKGASLGTFRWILIETAPVSESAEYTAWQEFSVSP